MSDAYKIASRRNNDNKLQNSSTMIFEFAVVGSEYISTEQHGGIFGGIIYRRYYSIPDAPSAGGSAIFIPLGFIVTGKIVNITGVSLNQNGNEWQPMPFVDFGSSVRNIELKVQGNEIHMLAGSGQDWQHGGYIWVDYTR